MPQSIRNSLGNRTYPLFDFPSHRVGTQNTRAKANTNEKQWVLTEEDVLEPPRLLKQALKRSGIPEEGVFDVCDIGESREF